MKLQKKQEMPERRAENTISITSSTSPYFISISDNPGISITPILFDGNNFDARVSTLENSFQAKTKMPFFKRTLARPTDPNRVAEGIVAIHM